MTTQNLQRVEITVTPFYEEDQSNPSEPIFFFSYQITIENKGSTSIRLLHRCWEIWDAGSEKKIVAGKGVIGQQPKLQPEEEFSYKSFCQFRSPFGKMNGYYTFEEISTGTLFQRVVPEMNFVYPVIKN